MQHDPARIHVQHPERAEPVTLPAWIPLGFLILVLLGVGLFTLDPIATARALLSMHTWPKQAQRAMIAAFCLTWLALLGLAFRRLTLVMPGGALWTPPPKRKLGERVSLGIFLGSGGHSAEMEALLRGVDFARYEPRTYVYCGDEASLRVVAALEGGERKKGKDVYELVALPRARAVGEGKVSTLISGTLSALHALYHTLLVPLVNAPFKPWVDVLVLNGPGTSVVLVAVAYIRRILGLSHTRIVYVESFARVKSLSLSGKILKNFADTFVVQWPEAAGAEMTPVDESASSAPRLAEQQAQEEMQRAYQEKVARTVYRGWLV